MSSEIDFTPQQRVRPAPGCPGILVAHLGSAPKPYVYVGRAMKGIPASPLGNPFRPSEVDDAIGRFRQWLRDAYKAHRDGRASQEQHAAATELQRLAELFREEGRLTLACWCATGPNPDDGPCHADVIAQAIVGIVAAEPVTIEIPGVGACCARWEPTDDGLPWEVTKDGRDVRLAATLVQAREPLARRVTSLGPGASAQLAAMGMGKCDSCGEVKPGIGHKELCAECLLDALPSAQPRPATVDVLAAGWRAVLRDTRPLSPSVEAVLHGARPIAVTDGVVELEVQSAFHRDALLRPANRRVAERVLSKHLGGPHTIAVSTR